MNFDFILYGANGYTGQLLAKEAVRRGHRPLLAGRSGAKLKSLADELGLEWRAVALDDPRALAQLLGSAPVVLHAAGPFTFTGKPMLQACLDAGVSYLDITGEINYMEHVFSCNAQAQQRGITVITGAGLDVVPSDCLAVYVAQQLPQATRLEIALRSTGGISNGTMRSSLEAMSAGVVERVDGRLVPIRQGRGIRRVRFLDKEHAVIPSPWGDLVTAYHSTGIPNIRTYLAVPARYARLVQVGRPVISGLLSIAPLRRSISRLLDAATGPSAEAQQRGHSSLWARATAETGQFREAWLQTLSGYTLTAQTGVRLVEKVLVGAPHGACSPAQAFGPDLILEIEGTHRYDTVPPSA